MRSILDSRHYIPDALSADFGFRIVIVGGIPDY